MSTSASLPRIIDHWLGGTQHTPVDAQAAQALAAQTPALPELYRAQRAFQQYAAQAATTEGIRQFMVFEAGLPTGNHIHEQLPEVKVYYSDSDFDVVQPGAGLLAGIRRRVRYQTLDPADREALDDLEFSPVLAVTEPVAIVLAGAAEGRDDDTLRVSLANLYTWATEGSVLILTHLTPAAAQVGITGDEGIRGALHTRDTDALATLLGDWKVDGSGITPLSTVLPGGPTWMVGLVARK